MKHVHLGDERDLPRQAARTTPTRTGEAAGRTGIGDNRRVNTEISIAPEVTAQYPAYRATVVLAHGLRNGPSGPETVDYLADAVATAVKTLDGRKPGEHPQLAAWRRIYQSFGVKPSRFYCSAEALARRAQSGQVPSINELVDLYNAVSLRHLLPAGGEDAGALQGELVLRFATGDEPCDIPERPDGPTAPAIGEPVWADDAGVTCRRWNWRQGRRTALTDQTTDAFFLLDAADESSYEPLADATAELTDLLTRRPGATVTTRSFSNV
ncbi:B3/B4 domain-containing protein [Fodinicola feengrottensis]|uniref:B3/B4 domain-containing protein n=1 Tax=Fodinicola feengrottensis TaxID=435914 RepID=UPI0031D3D3B6